MRKYLNGTNVPLSVAVFLANDSYDHDDKTVSATKLIKPVRQIILGGRVPQEMSLVDIAGLFKSRLGTALHDSIETAWVDHHVSAMQALGYPQRVIDKVKVNPNQEEVDEDTIAVYLEHRAYKQVGDVTVSGKFDFVAEGRVEDFKSTSVFMYMKQSKDEDYALQGSLYRWLNPGIITEDQMAINFLLTDYMPARAATDPSYPKSSTPQRLIPLLSVEQTDAWVKAKLAYISKYLDAPEADIPHCNDQELWRSDPQFKYYKNPDKTSRSTKNFATQQEAYARLAQDGGTGMVVEKPGEVMACKYCPAFPICTQKDLLIADGSLKL